MNATGIVKMIQRHICEAQRAANKAMEHDELLKYTLLCHDVETFHKLIREINAIIEYEESVEE